MSGASSRTRRSGSPRGFRMRRVERERDGPRFGMVVSVWARHGLWPTGLACTAAAVLFATTGALARPSDGALTQLRAGAVVWRTRIAAVLLERLAGTRLCSRRTSGFCTWRRATRRWLATGGTRGPVD